MKFEDSTYDQINAYLSGIMNQVDKELFELRIKTDSELRAEVDLHRSLKSTFGKEAWSTREDMKNGDEILEIKNLRKGELYTGIEVNIQEVSNQYFKNIDSEKNKKWRNYLGIIAAVLCVLLLTYYFNTANSSVNSLYSDYNDWRELPSLTVQGDPESYLAKAEQLFYEKRYNEAISIFDTELKNQPENKINGLVPYILVYTGVCYLELEDYESALKTFDILLKSNALDRSKGYWYKALVYMKKGDKERTKEQLSLILKDEKNFNLNKAKLLLEKLD
ncbi:tol-pal system YbgF family protein [Aquimarina sp. AU474]|uniref:tetratricopeptide repeat protein n=1 Tax=Aquimarina sp. AU474 TaxID=2108529 RepID=UPI000D69BEF6|nr:hypothetical protein [Aquimarina sp. AU474]